MRTKELMLYKHMEHEELLRDMTFLMENCDSDYYNKEDMAGLLFECVNELLELAAGYGLEGNLWHNYLTFLLVNDENAYSTECEQKAPALRKRARESYLHIPAFSPLYGAEKGRIARLDVGGYRLRQKAPERQQKQNRQPQERDNANHHAKDKEQ